jgi:hypothetical protein
LIINPARLLRSRYRSGGCFRLQCLLYQHSTLALTLFVKAAIFLPVEVLPSVDPGLLAMRID